MSSELSDMELDAIVQEVSPLPFVSPSECECRSAGRPGAGRGYGIPSGEVRRLGRARIRCGCQLGEATGRAPQLL